MKTQELSLSKITLMFLKYAGIPILTLYACLISTGLARAQDSPRGVAHILLPADLSGILNGAEYKIRVPANWNGTLLVYCHGSASMFVEVAPQTFPTAAPTLEEQLLSLGYALAGSWYKDSVKEGDLRTLALTNFFKGAVGNPRRIMVWGVSLGAQVSMDLIEKHHGIYDGAIPVAGAGEGMPKFTDMLLRYDLAYAAVFGWPTGWWGPIEDLRDDLYGNEATLIAPVFHWFDGTNLGEWEFIRLVMKQSPQAWWGTDPTIGFPGWAISGWAATAVRSREEHECGGPTAENIGVVYTLTSQEKSYLSGLGVDADARLAWMNAHTNITARRSARVHCAQYGTPSGQLRRPVVTMHGIFDPIDPVSGEAAYGDLVDAAGDGDKLVQVYVNTYHASFSAEQFLATVAAMTYWLDTGDKPDASFFPASKGFDPAFVPPPWPY